MIPAKQEPLQILMQFVAAAAPGYGLDHDFFPVTFDVFAEKCESVLDSFVDFGHFSKRTLAACSLPDR